MTTQDSTGTERSIATFVGAGASYYQRQFARLQGARGWLPSLNGAALAWGPLWAASRGVWSLFWIGAAAELMALIQIGRGGFGNLGADLLTKATSLRAIAADRLADADAARAAGDSLTAETFRHIATNLTAAANDAAAQAQVVSAGGHHLVWIGLGLLVAARLTGALSANALYEAQYSAWRGGASTATGRRAMPMVLAALGLTCAYPVTIFRFAAQSVPPALLHVPVRRDLFAALAKAIDRVF